MKIDVTECAEFQELRPPHAYDKVISVTVSNETIEFHLARGTSVTYNLQRIIEGCWGIRIQREVAVLKKHFPEAFI